MTQFNSWQVWVMAHGLGVFSVTCVKLRFFAAAMGRSLSASAGCHWRWLHALHRFIAADSRGHELHDGVAAERSRHNGNDLRRRDAHSFPPDGDALQAQRCATMWEVQQVPCVWSAS